MWNPRWWLALPLALAVSIGSAHASSIRDDAGLFDPETVRTAEAKLNQVERDSGITTTIETINSLQGQSLDSAAIERARGTGTEGIFILIPKQERKIKVMASRHFASALPHERLRVIEEAFVNQFKGGDFDAGLKNGVQAIVREVEEARVAHGGRLRQAGGPIAPIPGRAVARPRANAAGFGLGSLLGIGLIILAVLIGIRLLGRLFGGGQGAYGPGMGRPGMGPGYGGPGYGGPGYGGRGGGFMSSLFGGIGGAMAGNWLYDQFSGRHHGGSVDSTSYTPGSDVAPTGDAAGDNWSTGNSTSGDWGGGDAGGGGGDWGGGGGGDWGGGGGGGDWGGGGGDGGSW